MLTARLFTRRLVTAAFCSFTAAAVLVPASGEVSAAPLAPTVTGVNPLGGSECGGTSLTITGTNFTGANEVDFNSTTTAATVAVTTGLTVNVAGTSIMMTTPPFDPVVTDVVVKTPLGGASSTSLADRFTFTDDAPTVTSLSVTRGPTDGLTALTITGTCFVDAGNVDTGNVLFGLTPAANVTVNSNTSISATSPAEAAGTVDVTVSTLDGFTSSTGPGDQFTFVAAPSLDPDTPVTPTMGPAAGGQQVTVTGSGFQGGTGSCDVTHVLFGTSDATLPASCTDTSITVTTPAHAAGQVVVSLSTDGGSASTANPAYSFVSAPTVTSVTPTAGTTAGGTQVTVSGTNFDDGLGGDCTISGVSFGTAAADLNTITNCTATSFDIASPGHAQATVDVTVTTDGGTSATSSSDRYGYVAPKPTVSSVSPNAGPEGGGQTVTVTGTGFTGVTGVTFGTTAGTNVQEISDTSLTVTSPAGTAGTTVDVKVTTAGGTSNAGTGDHYTYVAAPTVTSVSPTSGPAAGANNVTINGTGFFSDQGVCDVTAVNFGSNAAGAPTACSDTSLTVAAPAGAVGTVDVTVTTGDGGTSATSASDHYTYVAAPTVTSVSPASGPAAGGNLVTVNGTGFFSDKGACDVTDVKFGSTSAGVPASCSDTSLTVRAPSGAPGVVDVTVTTGDGGTSALSGSDHYTFAGSWTKRPGSGHFVAAGGGQVFLLGTDSTPSGFSVYHWTGSGWAKFGGSGVVLAVDSAGKPWLVNSANQVYAWTGSSWVRKPGSAKYIAAGEDGSVYILGTNAVNGGYGIWKYAPGSNSWGAISGGMVDLSVGKDGTLWGVNSSHKIYRRTSGSWSQLPGSALDVAAGNSNYAVIVGTNAVPGGDGVYVWTGSSWRAWPGGLVQVALDNVGGAIWGVNSTHSIYSFS